MGTPLWQLTIHEAAKLLRKGEITSVELTEAVLRRIEETDRVLNAFITVTADLGLEQAREADRILAAGKGTPLTGIPAAIKDIICTRGVATTCASRILANFVPPYEATVIERLRAAGMVMIGKTNMDEFAMGSSGENSAFGPTRNPWDLSRVPGGSSSGSAAAVAAHQCIYALGSDTGGSIRQPASLCGVVGLKPTYGRVSRYGLVAFASSLDQIGPITKDVQDAALVLQVIAGHDPRDSTSAPVDVPNYSDALVPHLKGIRVGVPREYLGEGVEEGTRQAIMEAIKVIEELGAEVDWDVSLPTTPYALACYYIIAPSEASANLARYDGVKYGYSYQEGASMWENMEKTRQFGFGPEVKRRIMLGTYSLSAGYYDAYYLKALKVRTLVCQEFRKALEDHDVLVTPVSPTPAFLLGEKVEDPLQMYLSDIFTIPVNIAGLPAISVPCGLSNGLPVGLQVIGRPFEEEVVLRVGYAYEQATPWHQRRPPL